MSLTVALKYDGVIYMGSDSLAYRGGVKNYLTNMNCYRIFPVKGCDNMLMSLDGRLLEHNVARCSYLVPEIVAIRGDVDFEFMVNEFIPHLFGIYDDRNLLSKDNGQIHCESDMIVAYEDKLFGIFSDGAVLEYDDYIAIGEGVEEALGSLISTCNIENPVERILLALRAGLKNKTRVSFPLVISNTATCEFETFYE